MPVFNDVERVAPLIWQDDTGLGLKILNSAFVNDTEFLVHFESDNTKNFFWRISLDSLSERNLLHFLTPLVDIIYLKNNWVVLISKDNVMLYSVKQPAKVHKIFQEEIAKSHVILKHQLVKDNLYLLTKLQNKYFLIKLTIANQTKLIVQCLDNMLLDQLPQHFYVVENGAKLVLFLFDQDANTTEIRVFAIRENFSVFEPFYRAIRKLDSAISAIALSKDQQYILFIQNNMIYYFSIKRKLIKPLKIFNELIPFLFDKNNPLLFCISNDKHNVFIVFYQLTKDTIFLCDTREPSPSDTRKPQPKKHLITLLSGDDILDVKFSPDNKKIMVIQENKLSCIELDVNVVDPRSKLGPEKQKKCVIC